MKLAAGIILVGVIALLLATESGTAPVATSTSTSALTATATATAFAQGEQRTVVMAPADFVKLGAAFAARAGRGGDVSATVAEARAGRIDPVELGGRLRGHRELGPELLEAMMAEHSPAIALQLAQALAALEDDAALRRQTIDALRAGSPEARSVGLLSLLGRGEPDALQLAEETLASHAPAETRATAAFLLNNAPAQPDPGSYAAAREALQDPQASARLREESATLLGRPAAPETDLSLLERTVFEGEPAVRMRALAALDIAADSRLQAICDRIAADSSAPARLAEMARAWRAAHP